MNPDAVVKTRGPVWERLDELAKTKHLTAAEAEELLDLYRQTGADVSRVTTTGTDPVLRSVLSQKLIRARRRLQGQTEPLQREFRNFFVVSLPTALWRIRYLTGAVALIFCALGLAVGLWVANTPEVLNALISPEEAKKLVEQDFVAYYSDGRDVAFFSKVWFNNGWLAVLGVALGVTGFYPLMLLLVNALNVGVTGGIMAAYGGQATFFTFIAPHGFLELTAIFTSIAAGFRLTWAWLPAGKAPRNVTLAKEGRTFAVVSLGLVLALLLSAIVEAFVTPSGLPAPVRIVIGFLALVAYLAYAGILGRRAEKQGLTGDIDKSQRGSQLTYSA